MQSQLIAQGEDEMRALHSGRGKAVVPRNPDLRFNSTTKTCKPSSIRWCRVFQGWFLRISSSRGRRLLVVVVNLVADLFGLNLLFYVYALIRFYLEWSLLHAASDPHEETGAAGCREAADDAGWEPYWLISICGIEKPWSILLKMYFNLNFMVLGLTYLTLVRPFFSFCFYSFLGKKYEANLQVKVI